MTNTWQIRHQGSPRIVQGLHWVEIVEGLRDGLWEPTDEVLGPGDKSWLAIENAKLRDALRPYVRGEDGKTEVLLDARDISWGTVIAIQDAAKSAGIRQIRHLLKKK